MDNGLIIDIETTGLDPEADHLIEIGVLEFCLEGGEAPQIVSTYGGLQDPHVPLKEDVQRLTGLNNKQLAGCRIEWPLVRKLFERSAIVIAHNMDFDRSFLRRRPELEGLAVHWACSMRHIDWQKHGFKTRSLNYLAADHGFINPFAHRAVFDCAATFRLIAPHLEELVAKSYEREFMIKACDSPFDAKDALKERRYRWDPEERVWGRMVTEGELDAERRFLSECVYEGATRHQEIDMTCV